MTENKVYKTNKDMEEDKVTREESKAIGSSLEKAKDVNRPGFNKDLADSKKDFNK